MKKFWNLMLAALVIFGAVACTENQEENIPQEEQKAVLSFVANIANDETRTYMEQDGNVWKTKWNGDETLYVYNYEVSDDTFEFTNTKEYPEVFKCTQEGVLELLGKPVQIDNNLYGIDSTTGQAGAYLHGYQGEFNPATTITLDVQCAFFHFTAAQDVTLKASKCIFGDKDIAQAGYVDTIEFSAGEHWVAFLPRECTLEAIIDGETVKSTKEPLDFVAKKIYNLGFLGVESGWEISDKTPFYNTETPDLFVAKNVMLTANNFCLHKVGDTAWGAGAKYGLVTGGKKNENTAIGLFSANWANDITISNATTTAHDIYFDKANSRLYVMTVGKTPDEVTKPTNSNSYNIAGTMNNWGSNIDGYKFTYSGDNVWHLVIDFKANDEFKVQLNNGWGTCYGHNQIQSGVGRDLSNGSDNAKIKAAGTYEIWVLPTHSDAPLYIIKK